MMCTVYSYMYWRTLEHCVRSMLMVLTAWALVLLEDVVVAGLSKLNTGCNMYSMMLT